MALSKKLTPGQLDSFLKENRHGILSMQGKTPYALPMGYMYKRKTLLLGMFPTGRKMKYLQKDNAVCYTVCRPRWQTEGQKTPCTSVARSRRAASREGGSLRARPASHSYQGTPPFARFRAAKSA